MKFHYLIQHDLGLQCHVSCGSAEAETHEVLESTRLDDIQRVQLHQSSFIMNARRLAFERHMPHDDRTRATRGDSGGRNLERGFQELN